jgi:hypothetical protein
MASFLDTQHPEYRARSDDWTLLHDTFNGERVIKAEKQRYLPATSGQVSLGMGQNADGSARAGQALYDAYVQRAVFHDVVRNTVDSLVGLMVREPWQIELPAAIEYMADRASVRGESLEDLTRRILRNVMLYGRIGLLNDVRDAESEIYIADYSALKIINWDDTPPDDSSMRKLRMVVLDESRWERKPNGVDWDWIERYRKLTCEDNNFEVQIEIDGNLGEVIEPSLRGQRLDYMPFTFINTTDLVPEPGEVPLLGLGRLAVTLYRGEADYRHSLFMQGQDTLVLTGIANPGGDGVNMVDPSGHVSINNNSAMPNQIGSDLVIGAGAVIYLPDPSSDAKFIGVESKGLEEQRQAIENDMARAESQGLALLTSGAAPEASDTLHTRIAARTASLSSIVRTAAAGLEQQLQWAAEWAGGNAAEVKVVPNLDFVENMIEVAEVSGLWGLKMQGFPISAQSIHMLAQKGELTEMSLSEELEAIADEPTLGIDFDEDVGEETPADGD